ncbi:hypothetical protein Tco_0085099 [Tanacetum coccineum]
MANQQGRLRCKGVTKQIIGVIPKGLALRVVLVDLHSKDESGKGFNMEERIFKKRNKKKAKSKQIQAWSGKGKVKSQAK